MGGEETTAPRNIYIAVVVVSFLLLLLPSLRVSIGAAIKPAAAAALIANIPLMQNSRDFATKIYIHIVCICTYLHEERS